MINNNSLWFESYNKVNFDFSKTFHNLSIFKGLEKRFQITKDFQGPYEPCNITSILHFQSATELDLISIIKELKDKKALVI